jgi:hypothetical protein
MGAVCCGEARTKPSGNEKQALLKEHQTQRVEDKELVQKQDQKDKLADQKK